mgnify:FL=1|jgi:hypothetical protein
MASILKVDTLTGVTTAGSISVTGEGNSTTTNLQQGLAKAWVNYAQATPLLKDSFNVSSVSDDATGDYTQSYTSSFDSTYYSIVATSEDYHQRTRTKATGTTQCQNWYVSSTGGGRTTTDGNDYNTQTHGDLA